jgi:hypothetical protein
MHDTIAPARPLCITLLALTLSGVVGACSAPENQGTEGQDTASVADDIQPAGSTAVGETPPAPPPGTVRIRGSVLSCDEETETGERRCEIAIESIVAYGASTAPLATVNRTVLAAPPVFSGRSAEVLVSAGTLTMVLEHAGDQPQMGGASEQSVSWRLAETLE